MLRASPFMPHPRIHTNVILHVTVNDSTGAASYSTQTGGRHPHKYPVTSGGDRGRKSGVSGPRWMNVELTKGKGVGEPTEV